MLKMVRSLLGKRQMQKVKVTFPLLSTFYPPECAACPCTRGDRIHVTNSFFSDDVSVLYNGSRVFHVSDKLV